MTDTDTMPAPDPDDEGFHDQGAGADPAADDDEQAGTADQPDDAAPSDDVAF